MYKLYKHQWVVICTYMYMYNGILHCTMVRLMDSSPSLLSSLPPFSLPSLPSPSPPFSPPPPSLKELRRVSEVLNVRESKMLQMSTQNIELMESNQELQR